MNKIFNKLFLGLAVCGLAMTACSDGVEWEPSPVPTEGVYRMCNCGKERR